MNKEYKEGGSSEKHNIHLWIACLGRMKSRTLDTKDGDILMRDDAVRV